MPALGIHKDSISTVSAITVLAYLSADVAHHVLGHGVACLAAGGRLVSLSSVFVNCTVKGAGIDLAGPTANLVLGVIAMMALRFAAPASVAGRLCCILVAGFNLLWLELQAAFSAASRTDDLAWPMQFYHVPDVARYGVLVLSLVMYWMTVRALAVWLAPFSAPAGRARAIVWMAWLTAGIAAGITAAFDPRAGQVMLRSALPQSLLLSIGLLFVPARAERRAGDVAASAVIEFSSGWIAAAALAGMVSVYFLGPGFALG